MLVTEKMESLMIKASLDESISHALKLKYEAQAAEARTNIDIYMENPAGIGEHSDIVAAVDEQLAKLAEALDKLEALDNYLQ